MNKFLFLLGQVCRRRTVLRAYLNHSLLSVRLRGNTIDIGGGASEEYVSFVSRDPDTQLRTLDPKAGSAIDFEEDDLPAADGEFDTVVFLNVMEHVFNYRHIARETLRIVKPGGQLIGYVPFLIPYHPDPRDYFRYTHAALERIFRGAGADDVTVTECACGPFIAGAQMFLHYLPLVLRPPVFSLFYLLDRLYLRLRRPGSSGRHALGYLFTITKPLAP